jgi:hypothetical protein
MFCCHVNKIPGGKFSDWSLPPLANVEILPFQFTLPA